MHAGSASSRTGQRGRTADSVSEQRGRGIAGDVIGRGARSNANYAFPVGFLRRLGSGRRKERREAGTLLFSSTLHLAHLPHPPTVILERRLTFECCVIRVTGLCGWPSSCSPPMWALLLLEFNKITAVRYIRDKSRTLVGPRNGQQSVSLWPVTCACPLKEAWGRRPGRGRTARVGAAGESWAGHRRERTA